jgi:hypothetical protein
MSELPNTPVYDSTPPTSEPFYKIWLKALTKPSEQTFAEIATSPGANPNKAYLWMALSSVVTFFISILVVSLSGRYGNFGNSMISSVISLICGAPIGAAIGVLFFALFIAIIQWVAKLFKGTGSYSQLVYSAATFMAPISLITGLLSTLNLIPFIGLCFSLIGGALGIYSLVLLVMAVKGVNKFGWGEAAGSVFLPGLIIGFICACVVVGILMVLAPVIGNVFSTINQSLGY